jgi:hypothetical protein
VQRENQNISDVAEDGRTSRGWMYQEALYNFARTMPTVKVPFL